MSDTAIDTLSCSELPDESWLTPKEPVSTWPRPIRKTIYTLDVAPDGAGSYDPQITTLTYPLLKAYAEKIGADFHVITERKRPEWPITIEKFQVAELAKQRGDDWSIFVDADTLISPEMFDITEHMPKNTVAHNGNDMANVRWKYDHYFRRDGRNFGSCTWLVVASDWCVEDLWQLPGMLPEQAYANINLTIQEHNSGCCQTEHLIDDYTLSRNIARFGLKTTTVTEICGRLAWKTPDGRAFSPFLWHIYNCTRELKLSRMLMVLSTPNGHIIPDPSNPNAPPIGVGWGLMLPEKADELRKKWGVR
jgi:hypothetical protein